MSRSDETLQAVYGILCDSDDPTDQKLLAAAAAAFHDIASKLPVSFISSYALSAAEKPTFAREVIEVLEASINAEPELLAYWKGIKRACSSSYRATLSITSGVSQMSLTASERVTDWNEIVEREQRDKRARLCSLQLQ